jgi:hypothetical protein
MTHKSIEEYITYLVDNQVNINIIEFVKEINKIKYKIDITFIDEFIELVSKDECCIRHDMLQKYGVSNLKGGTGDVKKILDQNKFIENDEYLLRNVSELHESGKKYKNEYYLHPESFKICLMRSLKTNIYAKYYLLLEKCIKYFNDYQIELNKKYIIKLKNKIAKKDNKIDSLEEKLNIIIENNKELIKSNNELLNRSKKSEKNDRKMKQQLEDITINLDDIKEELSESNTKLDYTCKKLDIAVEDRVPKTDNLNTLEDFILLKSKNKKELYRYYVIRGQSKYVKHKFLKNLCFRINLIKIEDIN